MIQLIIKDDRHSKDTFQQQHIILPKYTYTHTQYVYTGNHETFITYPKFVCAGTGVAVAATDLHSCARYNETSNPKAFSSIYTYCTVQIYGLECVFFCYVCMCNMISVVCHVIDVCVCV